jgi:hypothetical protein
MSKVKNKARRMPAVKAPAEDISGAAPDRSAGRPMMESRADLTPAQIQMLDKWDGPAKLKAAQARLAAAWTVTDHLEPPWSYDDQIAISTLIGEALEDLEAGLDLFVQYIRQTDSRSAAKAAARKAS